MITPAEATVNRSLLTILADLPLDAPIPDSEPFRDLQSGFEYLLPAVLGWRHESLDAFRFAVACKRGEAEAEFIGLCLLITDQAWTPLHLRIRASTTSDALAWLECRLGESRQGDGGIERTPYAASHVTELLLSLPQRIHSIQWAHTVVLGTGGDAA